MALDQHTASTPVPDPTLLTTEALKREIASLKEVVFTRLDGMDKAVSIFREDITRVPTDTDKQIQHLKELVLETFEVVHEKFRSVQTQFVERDVRVEQTAKDTKIAVDAALTAAEKAVGKQNESFSLSINKSEAATTKQIDQLGQVIQSETKALLGFINDMKDRLNRIEGQDVGKQTAVTTQQTSNTSLVAIIGLAIGTIIGIGGLIVAFAQRAG